MSDHRWKVFVVISELHSVLVLIKGALVVEKTFDVKSKINIICFIVFAFLYTVKN